MRNAYNTWDAVMRKLIDIIWEAKVLNLSDRRKMSRAVYGSPTEVSHWADIMEHGYYVGLAKGCVTVAYTGNLTVVVTADSIQVLV